MHLLRRLLIVVTLGLAFGATARPSVAQGDPFGTIKRIQQSGALRMPVMIGEEPGYVKDPKTGEWSGYYIDWAKDIATLLGVKTTFYETTWGNLAADFQAGKIDLAIGLNPNPRRGLVVDYVPGAIWSGVWALIAKPNFAAATWQDINKQQLRIAVQQGSTMQVIAEAVIPQAKILIVPTRDQALLEMQANRVDAILLADSDAVLLQSQNRGKVVVPEPILYNPATIGIRREEGNAGYMNFLANWMTQQRELGFARARLQAAWLAMGMDLSQVPLR